MSRHVWYYLDTVGPSSSIWCVPYHERKWMEKDLALFVWTPLRINTLILSLLSFQDSKRSLLQVTHLPSARRVPTEISMQLAKPPAGGIMTLSYAMLSRRESKRWGNYSFRILPHLFLNQIKNKVVSHRIWLEPFQISQNWTPLYPLQLSRENWQLWFSNALGFSHQKQCCSHQMT